MKIRSKEGRIEESGTWQTKIMIMPRAAHGKEIILNARKKMNENIKIHIKVNKNSLTPIKEDN